MERQTDREREGERGQTYTEKEREREDRQTVIER
jgi:hypothetical protein